MSVAELIRKFDRDARSIFTAALQSVSPDVLVSQALDDKNIRQLIDSARRLHVLSCGKAAVPMSQAFASKVGRSDVTGMITCPHGFSSDGTPPSFEVTFAGHPVPDRSSLDAGRRALEIVRSAVNGDLVVVLLSGGGSALWVALPRGIELEAVQQTVSHLLGTGATIHELNSVRKHLSAIKGGQLAVASAAPVVTLIISDVIGDDPSTIASGPTMPDPTTFADAIEVLRRCGGESSYPAEVVRFLRRGAEGLEPETPKPGEAGFRSNVSLVIGNNRVALEAARRIAVDLGYETDLVTDRLSGEAAELGQALARSLLADDGSANVCRLWGGESTVHLRGDGKGGRNQELALSAALTLAGAKRPVVLLSGGTDGIDGPTDAAGAVVSNRTVGDAASFGLDASDYLARNDSYAFFNRAGGHLKTGPTHTNVMDIQIGLSGPEVTL